MTVSHHSNGTSQPSTQAAIQTRIKSQLKACVTPQVLSQFQRLRRRAGLESVSRHGIFAQTLTVILGVSLVPSLGLMIANHRSSQLQAAALKAEFEKTATATELQVEQWLNTNLLALRQNASLADVVSMEMEQQNPVMEALVKTYDWTYTAFVVGPHGYQTARNDAAAKPIQKWNGELAHFRGDREYFRQVRDGAEAGYELLISPTTNLPALCLSVPIEQQRAWVGALTSCSHLDAIADAVVNTQVGETGFAILVDAENRVIAKGKRLRTAEELEDFSDYPALNTNRIEVPLRFSWRNQRVTAYVKPIGTEGWRLIIQQNTAEAYQAVSRGRWLTFFLLSGTGILTLGIAYKFSRQLVRPIESLTAVADEVSRGKLDVQISGSDRRDEIGALAQSLKRLANSVAIVFEELETQQAEAHPRKQAKSQSGAKSRSRAKSRPQAKSKPQMQQRGSGRVQPSQQQPSRPRPTQQQSSDQQLSNQKLSNQKLSHPPSQPLPSARSAS